MIKIKELKEDIKKDLNLHNEKEKKYENLNESVYMKIPKQFNIVTDILSSKNLKQHYELYQNYVKSLNRANIELNSMLKNGTKDIEQWRSLKKQEQYSSNASYLHELFFEQLGNTSNSVLNMDSISYLELQTTWGEFNLWQKDFINTSLASRNGWCITGYSFYAKKLMNICIDSHDLHNIPCFPLIVLDIFEHSYFQDYQLEKREYVFNFMKSLKWNVIEDRFEKLLELKKII